MNAKLHFSRIIEHKSCTVTTTLCSRMVAEEINATTDRSEVTCKLCLRALSTWGRSL